MCAAIEHWTAVIAVHALRDDELSDWQISDDARAFLAWHLVEELEHRAVAFDVMQAIGTSEAERILAMVLAEAMMIPSVVGGFLVSFLGDRDAWRPARLVRSIGRLRRSGVDGPSFVRGLMAWNRPGFHPDQHDIDDLLERWRAHLFGPDGIVTATTASGARATG